MESISLIVATKDRPDDLRRLLDSLRHQTERPSEIVVVDSSSVPVNYVIADFRDLTIIYIRHLPPSAAAQRNAGVRACSPASTLIGFADDDTTFEPSAFANMLSFWKEAAPDILGAAFNMRNYPSRGNRFLKQNAMAEWLGLYSSKPGSVLRSGWHTMIYEIEKTQFVDWLPSGAVVFRHQIFESDVFDEFFQGYSYLEDLDLSYTLSQMGRLAVVADAGYSHFPSKGGRVSARQFGRCEVRNRLYFVRKHRLSLLRCYLGMFIRLAMSVGSGMTHLDKSMFSRALGNIEELLNPTAIQSENNPTVA